MITVPFNRPHMNGRELYYISQAHTNRALAGDGPFTKACQNRLREILGVEAVFLMQSGTAALEAALLALNLEPGDEIILPSFTFVSCANAVLLAGGEPVFADIDPNTKGISLDSLQRSISCKTRAVIVVHYAGISSDIQEILDYCRRKGIFLIEDAAHCMGSHWRGRELGTFGDFGCFSFHETKNITCGEGGAIIVNNPKYVEIVERLREKGTDRSKFLRGDVDKYTWRGLGSSYAPSEITAAFLRAQLDDFEMVTAARRKIWFKYHELLENLEREGLLNRPILPNHCDPNGHIYYILMKTEHQRNKIIQSMRRVGIQTTFHYVPLHDSPYGARFKCDPDGMKTTNDVAARLLRLPLWLGLSEEQQITICTALNHMLRTYRQI